MVGVERKVTLELLTNDPPTTNATSAFCANASVAAHNSIIKIEKRFIEAPLIGIRFFGWLRILRCSFSGQSHRKILLELVTKGQALGGCPDLCRFHRTAELVVAVRLAWIPDILFRSGRPRRRA